MVYRSGQETSDSRFQTPDSRLQDSRLLFNDPGLAAAARIVNVTAATRVARQLGPGHLIVTVLCDTGAKYLSRLYNREWLAQKNLLDAALAG